MNIFLFIIICYGISNIIVFSYIFEKIRDVLEKVSPNFFGKMVNCMMCTSTWIGFLLSTIGYLLSYPVLSPMLHYGVDIFYLAIFLDGMLASGSVWLIHTIQEFFEK